MDYGSTTRSRLFGTIALDSRRAVVIRQSYGFLALAVLAAAFGGFVGATTPALVRLFSSMVGWILALVVLNVVPRIAIAARHNPVLGVSALVLDGFLSGLILAPILFIAANSAPDMILAALGITALVFVGVSAYVMFSGRTFSAPRGLMLGLFVSVIGAVILNSFLQIGVLGILISAAIGIIGVLALVYATSDVLNNPEADSPIPGALFLFAGLFNIFVAVLNLLLRFGGGGRRD